MKALLLAGGRGTRMRPLTYTSNKHAIPIANKPLILYPFEMIIKSGIKEIAVVVNETKDEIFEILGDGSQWNVHVEYLTQDHPGGLAHALGLAEKFMGNEKFVMVLGDNILEKGITRYVDEFQKDSKLNAFLLGVKVPVAEHKRFGMVTIDKNDLVLRYIEKPGVVEHSPLYDPERSFAVPGFYFFDHHVFQCFKGKDKIQPSTRGELEISSPYNWLIEHGYKAKMAEVKGWQKDPGDPVSTLLTNQIILSSLLKEKLAGDIDQTSKLEGKVRIEEGAIIEGCQIRGPVVIGKGCMLKNCYIGPYTSIYDNTRLTNCEIENSIVLGNVEIKNISKRLDSCIIGWHAQISGKLEHTSTLNLVIGDNSIVNL